MNLKQKEKRFKRLLYTTALYNYCGSSMNSLLNAQQISGLGKYSERHPYYVYYSLEEYETRIMEMKKWSEKTQKHAKRMIKEINELMECLKLGIELGYTEEEIHDFQNEQYIIRQRINQSQEKPILKETRDNKDVHVGSGGSNANKIRYPSKKRSRKIWSNFYKLFPITAEKDHWDGKTSNKMK